MNYAEWKAECERLTAEADRLGTEQQNTDRAASMQRMKANCVVYLGGTNDPHHSYEFRIRIDMSGEDTLRVYGPHSLNRQATLDGFTSAQLFVVARMRQEQERWVAGLRNELPTYKEFVAPAESTEKRVQCEGPGDPKCRWTGTMSQLELRDGLTLCPACGSSAVREDLDP
jgi:ssDNA-binding Zn-finger/Zn-ribbon topoisomerase 1